MPLIRATVSAKPKLVVVPRTAALRTAPVVSRPHHAPAAISSTLAPRASAHSGRRRRGGGSLGRREAQQHAGQSGGLTAAAAHSRGRIRSRRISADRGERHGEVEDQQRLHDGDAAGAQGHGLEEDGGDDGGNPAEPHGLVQQVPDQPPAETLLPRPCLAALRCTTDVRPLARAASTAKSTLSTAGHSPAAPATRRPRTAARHCSGSARHHTYDSSVPWRRTSRVGQWSDPPNGA